jgi:UDP-glucose:tetrahydrobiopterin glucosyltransferase
VLTNELDRDARARHPQARLIAMRIAVVAPLVAPLLEQAAHGNHQVLLDVARGLSDRGHDVTVFCRDGSDITGVPLEQIEVDGNNHRLAAERETIRVDGDSRAKGYVRLFEAVGAFRPDVVSQHAFDADAVRGAVGFPTVHTLHQPPIIPEVVEALADSRHVLAAVSRDAQSRWAEVGLTVGLLRNGVPDSIDGSDLPERYERDASAIVAGRICPAKGTAAGIRAAFQAGLKADVVGTVEDRHYFETEVAPHFETGYATFHGAVSRRDLADMLLHAEVALMPVDWDEPFGLVAAEAQMVGCPVVAYNRGALPEIVEHGFTGWIVPAGDENALAGAASMASSLPRQEIRRSALERLNVAAMIDAYEAALTAAVDGHPSEARPGGHRA